MGETIENIKLIDIEKEWGKFKDFLHDSLVEEALEAGMNVWCQMYAMEPRGDFDPKKGPWRYTRSDYWFDRKRPKKDSLEWYQCMHACHWIAPFACALGTIAYPDYSWSIVYSDKHAVAMGRHDEDGSIFLLDILGGRTLDQLLKDINWDCEGCYETFLEEQIVQFRVEYREHFKQQMETKNE